MTRALGWLVHGDLHQSMRYHPLAPLLVIQGALLGGFWLYQRRTRHDQPALSVRSAPIMRTLMVANALLVLLVWVIRLKLGSFDDLG